MAARAKKEKPAPGPDDLVRESAGIYRTGDERFEVQKSDAGWYLVDTEQENEFGQQLIHGPLPTLEAIRDAVPGARDLKPLLGVRPVTAGTRIKSTKADKPAPASQPQSWIDKLPDRESAEVRRLIRALEKEGMANAEEAVRRLRDQPTAIATKLIEQRLRALIEEQPVPDRGRAQQLVQRVAEILTSEGLVAPAPAPRWALVEIAPADTPPRAKIRPQI